MKKRSWYDFDGDNDRIDLPRVDVFEQERDPPVLVDEKGRPLGRPREPLGFAIPRRR